MAEVGLLHSSEEVCESRWSEGSSRKSFPAGKQPGHRRLRRMEPETKGVRYQSATYPKMQNLMHNVNEQTLMLEHRRQARKKSTGIDGIDKTAYTKLLEVSEVFHLPNAESP